ncbi:acyl-CoA thioesterase [Achromobacter sp. AGC39]
MIDQFASSANHDAKVSRIFLPKPYEVDFTGFLSNTVAPRWMEDLRVELMRVLFPAFAHGLPANLSVISESTIKYLRPVRYGDSIIGNCWIQSVSHIQWTLVFQFINQNHSEDSIYSKQIGAFINPKTFMPARIPKQLLKEIKNLLPSSGNN